MADGGYDTKVQQSQNNQNSTLTFYLFADDLLHRSELMAEMDMHAQQIQGSQGQAHSHTPFTVTPERHFGDHNLERQDLNQTGSRAVSYPQDDSMMVSSIRNKMSMLAPNDNGMGGMGRNHVHEMNSGRGANMGMRHTRDGSKNKSLNPGGVGRNALLSLTERDDDFEGSDWSGKPSVQLQMLMSPRLQSMDRAGLMHLHSCGFLGAEMGDDPAASAKLKQYPDAFCDALGNMTNAHSGRTEMDSTHALRRTADANGANGVCALTADNVEAHKQLVAEAWMRNLQSAQTDRLYLPESMVQRRTGSVEYASSLSPGPDCDQRSSPINYPLHNKQETSRHDPGGPLVSAHFVVGDPYAIAEEEGGGEISNMRTDKLNFRLGRLEVLSDVSDPVFFLARNRTCTHAPVLGDLNAIMDEDSRGICVL